MNKEDIEKRVLGAATELGIIMKVEKTIGPCKELEYLGIVLDTIKMEARISEERIDEMVDLMKTVYASEKVSIRQVAKVLGKQNFITRVVPTSKAFTARLIALTRGVSDNIRTRK